MITVVSFGFRNGAPIADRMFDCRGIINPHNVRKLRDLTGLDKPVQDFVKDSSVAKTMLAMAVELAKPNQTIAFGCFGGRHRSVVMAEWVAETLRKKGHEVQVKHRDL